MSAPTRDISEFEAARLIASSDPNMLRGPWVAYLADSDGFVYESVADVIADLGDEEEVRIGVVRGSAAPTERDGGLRLPGTNKVGDRAFEVEVYVDGEGDNADSAVTRYAQALAMAAGLNAVSGHEPAPGYPCHNESCGCRTAVNG
ncbi:hypothetical protein ACGFIW_01960 [Micromonospora sp. NPDC048935]|uniref:hypothetical protein n=1 Tax=Micromonospora sp. NPDC048935 TaxID=3364262 RepID=UPI00370FF7F3